jgi:Protein of unknown function (DUF1084)
VYAVRRGMLLSGTRWAPPRLLVHSLALACGVRTLSFGSCALLALDHSLPRLDRLLQVLFNTGDWAAINSYALLLLVWLGLLQQTRQHFYSPGRISRDWGIVFICIALALQVLQVALYIAVFLSSGAIADAVMSSIYITIAAFNFALPLLFIVGWLSSTLLYAGFPFRSEGAQSKWLRFSRLVVGWTLGRLLFALGALACASQNLVSAVNDVGAWLFSITMVTIFILAEILPFLACLGTDNLKAFTSLADGVGFDEEGDNGAVLLVDAEEEASVKA